MSEICPICGLPKELCTCEEREREEQKVRVYTEKRKYGKLVTLVEGIPASSAGKVASELKKKCATGGTAKEGRIELQGDQKKKVVEHLKSMGYSVSE